MSNSIVGMLLREAASLAVPYIKRILSESVDGLGASGEAAGRVVDAIAAYAGVSVQDLPATPVDTVRQAMLAAEPDAAAIWLESQRLTNETVALDYGKEPWWAWAWRPAWMWLLAIFWIYAIIIQPLASAWAEIEPVDVGVLMTLTGLFVAFYMGGHTAKSLLTKRS